MIINLARRSLCLSIAVVVLLSPAFPQTATSPEKWVSTWGAAMQQPAAGAAGYENQTIRMFVRTSIGGNRLRLRLSNTFGTAPLVLGPIHMALHGQGSAIVPGTDRQLSFNGRPTVKIPPGADVVSDPVALTLPALGDLAISVYAPGQTGPATRLGSALRTGYIAAGDVTGAAELTGASTTRAWFWISAVEVLAPANAGTVVVLGASSTAGTTSTVDANRSWPSVLAERLQANAASKHIGVVNRGIPGNKVLDNTTNGGLGALVRFDHDVLATSGVRWLMLFEGTNDVGGLRANPQSMTPDELIAAYKQIIERAHAHGIKVIGCTLNPFEGANFYSEQGEEARVAVNKWILTSGAFDAVVDFSPVVGDPANPKQLKPGFNNGDHLHPNDAGYKAMAEAIDLGIFTR